MQDPFKPKTDRMVAIAHAAMPILVDRLGGSVTVSQLELAALSDRYGGAVAVSAKEEEPGVFRLTLVRATPKVDAEKPVS